MLLMKEFREQRGLSAGQVVAVMREQFPGYDKYLQSKVENPDRYGVRLLNRAESLIDEAFTKTKPADRKRDRHKLPRRVHCRMTQAKFDLLQQRFSAQGFETMQDGIDHLIDEYLKEA